MMQRRSGPRVLRQFDASSRRDKLSPHAPLYQIHHIVERTGISREQLIEWEDVHHLLSPRHNANHKRIYSEHDLQHVQTLKHLILDRGIAPEVVAEVFAAAGLDLVPTLEDVFKPRPFMQLLHGIQTNLWHLGRVVQEGAHEADSLRTGLAAALLPLRIPFGAQVAQCWLAAPQGELDPVGLPSDRRALQAKICQVAASVFARREAQTVAHRQTSSLIIALPLILHQTCYGVLTLVRSAHQHVTPEEGRALAILVLQIAQTIAAVRLQDHLRDLKSWIELVHEGIIIKDAQLNTVICNEKARQLAANRSAYEAAIANGEEPPDLVWATMLPGNVPIPARDLPSTRVLQGRETMAQCEMECRPDPEGHPEQVIPLMVTAMPLRDQSGHDQGIIISLQDMQPIKDAERYKEEYFKRNVHDLRSTLTPILFNVNMIQKEAEKWHQHAINDQQFLKEISRRSASAEQAIARMNHEIGEIIDAEMETGSLHRMSLFDFVDSYLREQRVLYGKDRIQWDTYASNPRLMGYWNPREIESIIRNLVENALRYSPDDTMIYVQIFASEVHDKLMANLVVQDHGYGFPPEDRERIFLKHERSVAHMPIAIPGNGHGLYSSYEIARKYAGTLEGDSEGPNRGAIFILRLPLAGDQHDQKPQTLAPGEV